VCSSLGPCKCGLKKRECRDTNDCGTTNDKPTDSSIECGCQTNWECGNWSDCVDNKRTKECKDKNKCGYNASDCLVLELECDPNKPPVILECEEQWICTKDEPSYTDWGNCSLETEKTFRYQKNCYDKRNCGNEKNRPKEYRGCSERELNEIRDVIKYQEEKKKADQMKKKGNWCEVGYDTIKKGSSIGKIAGRQIRIPSIEKIGSDFKVSVYVSGSREFILSSKADSKKIILHGRPMVITLLSANQSAAELKGKYCIAETCDENWYCEEWEDFCSEEGVFRRTCFDINECETTENKPDETKSCESEVDIKMSQEEMMKKAKIMPETASEKAIEKLGELNFSIELKEVGKGEKAKLVYELSGKKQGRFLGLFKMPVRVVVQVDAETGDVIRIKKPWWSFLVRGV